MHNETNLKLSREVCERFDINRATLTRWVKIGYIKPALKMPGKRGGYLFEPGEVDRIAADRQAA